MERRAAFFLSPNLGDAMASTAAPPTIQLLDEHQVAAAYGLTERCLQKWRATGDGPPFVRISSRCVRYRVADLEAWVAARLRESTSAGGEAV